MVTVFEGRIFVAVLKIHIARVFIKGPATNKGTDNKFVTVTVSTDRGKVTDVSVIT